MHVRARGGSAGLQGGGGYIFLVWGFLGEVVDVILLLWGRELRFFKNSLLSAFFVASVCFLPFSYYRVEC